MTNIEMNQIIKSLVNNKPCLQAITIVPLLGILAFTGCSQLDGTAGRQAQTENGVAVYSEWSQPKLQSPDSKPDPGYKWFY